MRRLLRSGRRIFWQPAADTQVDDELADHLELTTRRLVAGGMVPDEARRAARQRFGNLEAIRTECRTLAHDVEMTMNRQDLWQEFRQDAAYGARALRRSPLFTTIAILTLAIGIGASTSIFSVVHAVLLRSLPYRDADRVVTIWNRYVQGGSWSETAIAPPEFVDIAEQNRAFDAVAAVGRAMANLTGTCDAGPCDPERVAGYSVTPNLFDLLGTRPSLGRAFIASDAEPGAESVVLLAHTLWVRRYGSDPSIVGRGISINGTLRTVVGVMPPGVAFPDAPVGFLADRGELWIPRNATGDHAEGRGNQYLGLVARRKEGSSLDFAQRDLDAISARFRTEHASRYDRETVQWGLAATSLRDDMVGDVRRPLMVVLGAVVLLMVIACTNVAHLSLARHAARLQEFSVRVALGAGRGRLARQVVTESLLLGMAASAAGIVLAAAGTFALARFGAGMIPFLDTIQVSPPVLLFAVMAGLTSALAAGVLPVLRSSTARIHQVLRAGRGEAGQTRGPLRRILVAAEVGLAIVILVGAGLLTRSFLALQRVDTGVDTGSALSFSVALPRARYADGAAMVAFHAQVQSRLAALPSVTATGGMDPLPLGTSGWSGSFDVEGQPAAPGQPEPHAEFAVTLPGFTAALGIQLVRGREFSDLDRRDAPLVVMVDERLAARYWPGEDPLGKRINPGSDWATVIGVVRHVYRGGPRDEGEPQIYLPFAQRPQAPLSYVLRTSVDPLSLVAAVRREVAAVDPDLPVARVATMESLEAASLARDRFNATMLGLFAITALLLASIGLYGVVGYLVTQRTAEIGVRLALGGRPGDVVRLVMREGLTMALGGIVAGVGASLALGRVVESLLYGVSANDPWTYAIISATLAIVAVVASAIPARRASRADPATILRA